ncbi:hypothetical protein JYG24_04350 [Lentisphaerota bacterium]|nr:hypothetical protein JYG24_04350 [Lentisphaerota bacterium]
MQKYNIGTESVLI